MRYRKLTDGGDYTFGNGQLDFYRDVPEAVGQAAQTRLELWLGEWFADLADGTPWMQGVMGKKDKVTADRTIRQRVLGTQGVISITEFESEVNPDTRTYIVTKLSINTIYGPTAIDLASRRDL